ncbi:MAG: outer membrane lipoprotein carrier protein LolA [Balneolaceae bacterium]
MKKIYRRYLTNWILFKIGILSLVLLLVSATPLQGQTPYFDRLKQNFENGEIFVATFTHEYRDAYTGEETVTEGKIWIGARNYRVESEEQVMVVDGEISRVYDAIRNRLLISSYDPEEDDFAPSRMLQGVDDSYMVQEESTSRGLRVTLESDDPFAIFNIVEIDLNPDGQPVSIEATDQADNILITSFENGNFIQADPSLFKIEVPEDAEQIDLRH